MCRTRARQRKSDRCIGDEANVWLWAWQKKWVPVTTANTTTGRSSLHTFSTLYLSQLPKYGLLSEENCESNTPNERRFELLRSLSPSHCNTDFSPNAAAPSSGLLTRGGRGGQVTSSPRQYCRNDACHRAYPIASPHLRPEEAQEVILYVLLPVPSASRVDCETDAQLQVRVPRRKQSLHVHLGPVFINLPSSLLHAGVMSVLESSARTTPEAHEVYLRQIRLVGTLASERRFTSMIEFRPVDHPCAPV